MKKVITVLLLMLLFAAFGINAFAATNEGISTCATNVITVITGFDISDSGNAEVTVKYFGYNGITQSAKITTKIERLVGGVWSTVEIGVYDNVWIDNSTQVNYTNTHSVQLTSRGTYRAVVVYEISGTGGATDVIERTIEKTY